MNDKTKTIAIVAIALLALIAVGFQASSMIKGDQPVVVKSAPPVPPGKGMKDAEMRAQGTAGTPSPSPEDALAGPSDGGAAAPPAPDDKSGR